MKIIYQTKSFRFGIIAMLLLSVCTILTSILTINVSNMILNSSRLAQSIEEFIADIDDCWYRYQSLEENFSQVDLEHTTSRLVESAARHSVGGSQLKTINDLSRGLNRSNGNHIIPKICLELTNLRKVEIELYRKAIEEWSNRANFFNWLIIGLQILTLVLVSTAFINHFKFLGERRKSVEANLELARLVETSHDAILSLDSEGRIKRWNPASETAFARQEQDLLNIHIQVLAANEDSRARLDKLAREGSFYGNEEIEFNKGDASSFVASVSASPVRNELNEVVSTTIVAKDVTEQAKLRQEQSDFIASLTHDLKNPLIANNQILQLITNGDIDSEKHMSLLSKVIQSNGEMIETFSSMLELYKINAGVFRAKPMPVEVSGLIYRLIQTYAHQAEAKGIEVFVKCGELREMYFIDPLLVQKVIGNLIDNAIKYSEANSRIQITVDQNADFLSFKIADEGKGINQEQIDNLFSLTNNRRLELSSGSSNIGLYLCFKLSKELGGELSYAPGIPMGSTFELRIPEKVVSLENRKRSLESECSTTSA